MPTNYLKGYVLDGTTRTEYEVNEGLLGGGGAFLPRGAYVTVDAGGSVKIDGRFWK